MDLCYPHGMMECRNIGIVWRAEAPKFFRSPEPIIPVFHYSNIPVTAKSMSSYGTNSLQKSSPGQETSGNGGVDKGFGLV